MVNYLVVDQRQIAPLIIESFPITCDRICLAWRASDNRIGIGKNLLRPVSKTGHVSEVRYFWIPVLKNGAWEGFNLTEGNRLPAKMLGCKACCLNATTDADEFHASPCGNLDRERFRSQRCCAHPLTGERCDARRI